MSGLPFRHLTLDWTYPGYRTANPACPRCCGWGELCSAPCDLAIREATAEDVLTVAQYAKTYGEGGVWEAACRVLRTVSAQEAARLARGEPLPDLPEKEAGG